MLGAMGIVTVADAELASVVARDWMLRPGL
jgi:hypothetical protein